MNIKTKNVFHSFTNSFLLFQSIFFCSNFKIKITTFIKNKLLLLKLVYFTIFYYKKSILIYISLSFFKENKSCIYLTLSLKKYKSVGKDTRILVIFKGIRMKMRKRFKLHIEHITLILPELSY